MKVTLLGGTRQTGEKSSVAMKSVSSGVNHRASTPTIGLTYTCRVEDYLVNLAFF